MSELIVIGYDNQATATQAYNQVLALNKDFVVKLTGLATLSVRPRRSCADLGRRGSELPVPQHR
jgi:uncharacterized membrane protein